jgi:hypothetical protein
MLMFYSFLKTIPYDYSYHQYLMHIFQIYPNLLNNFMVNPFLINWLIQFVHMSQEFWVIFVKLKQHHQLLDYNYFAECQFELHQDNFLIF